MRASSAVARIPVENRLAGIIDSGDNRLIGGRGGQATSGARPNDQLFSNNNLIRLGSEPMPNFGGVLGQEQNLLGIVPASEQD